MTPVLPLEGENRPESHIDPMDRKIEQDISRAEVFLGASQRERSNGEFRIAKNIDREDCSFHGPLPKHVGLPRGSVEDLRKLLDGLGIELSIEDRRVLGGDEDTIHMDRVLEYNRQPEFMRGLMTHRLTIEAIHAVRESSLSKREIIRRLGTSASQFYRLLDPSNSTKSIGQLIALLAAAGREVDFVVRESLA